jgi:hypothetical protein
MSFDVTFVDDYHGASVAVIGLKPIAKILSAFTPQVIIKNLNIIIEANLSDIVRAARGIAEARRRSGFLIEQTDYIMNGNLSGTAFSGAPYAFFQEKGGTTPTGGRVSGLNAFIPSALAGMRQYVADVQLFLGGLLKGGTFAPRPIKSIVRGAVTRAMSAGRGTHKYTSKIAIGGGKYRYVYPSSGQTSRFTRVLRPGTGKGFKGVGARRRVV